MEKFKLCQVGDYNYLYFFSVIIKRQAIFHGMKKKKEKEKSVHRSHTDPMVIKAADYMDREA